MIRALLFVLALWMPGSAGADDFRPSYLQITQTAADRYDVLWKVPALDEGTVLKLKPVFPQRTLEVSPQRSAYADGATVVRWAVEVHGGLDNKPITFDGLGLTRTDILVRLARLDGVAAGTPVELGGFAAARCGLDPRVVGDVLALAADPDTGAVDAARLFPEYLAAVERLSQFVDGWKAA